MHHIKLTWRVLWLALSLCLCSLGACGSQQHSEILVVVNSESSISRAIGEYYIRSRGVPARNLIRLAIPITDPQLANGGHESISRADFEEKIRRPLEKAMREQGFVNSIEIIVTTKGLPLAITGPAVAMETWLRDVSSASVDAELSILFSDQIGSAGIQTARNPFLGSDLSFGEFRRRHPTSPLRYMVARLTGYQDEIDPETGIPGDIKALIDRAQAEPTSTEPAGTWLVDEDPEMGGGYVAGNITMLTPTAAALKRLGLPLHFDQSADFASIEEPIQGYASWGSNDHNDPGPPYYGTIDGKRYPGSFAPRALAVDFVSTNARTFTHPPHYGQSLIADLIRHGASGAAGHVFEPTLPGVPRPHLMLPAYAQGMRAVEAFYRSIPFLGWMNIYVGDPLLRVPNPVAKNEDDRDGDGVPDAKDNCIEIANSDQRDSNSDGLGNLCDADIDGDGIVTTSWGIMFPLTRRGDIEWILQASSHGHYDPHCDLNGDNKVDSSDFSIAQQRLFHPPGPSGVARISLGSP